MREDWDGHDLQDATPKEHMKIQTDNVSVSELLSMARYYGVDIHSEDKEYWLLAAVKCAILAPVVTPWVQHEVDGLPVFKHLESGKISSRHPLDTAFLRFIRQLRALGPPLDNKLRCVMIVKDEDGTLRGFDVSTGELTDAKQPRDRLVIPCREADIPKYTLTAIELKKSNPDFRNAIEEEWLSSATPEYLSGADQYSPNTGMNSHSVRARGSEKLRQSVRISTVQQSQVKGNVRRHKPRLKDVSHLTFYTWWLEDHESDDLSFRDNGESVGGGITPRHLSLSLCLATGTFDVTIRGRLPKEQVLKLRNIAAVTSAQGMPVRAWDLYVGARLNILNNPVSLRACDVPTGLWLASLAEKVLSIKNSALRELRKYSQEPLPRGLSHVCGEGGGRFLNSYTPAIMQQRQGGVNVQAAAEQVDWVCTFLDKYRPAASARYRKNLLNLRNQTTRSRVYPYQSSPPSALQHLAQKAAEAIEAENRCHGTIQATECSALGESENALNVVVFVSGDVRSTLEMYAVDDDKTDGALCGTNAALQSENVSSHLTSRKQNQAESLRSELQSSWPGPQVLLNTLPLSLTCPALVPAKGKDVWRTKQSPHAQRIA